MCFVCFPSAFCFVCYLSFPFFSYIFLAVPFCSLVFSLSSSFLDFWVCGAVSLFPLYEIFCLVNMSLKEMLLAPVVVCDIFRWHRLKKHDA